MEDWIKKLTSGTQDAWDEFITCFNRLIYKVFWTRSFGFSREEIDELFHDFLVSMMENNYKKVRLFEGRNNCSFASYLKKIAINMAIDRKKKLVRHRMASLNKPLEGRDKEKGKALGDLVDSGALAPEEAVIDEEEAGQYLEALYQLAPQRLIVVVMIIYHDYDREALGRLLKTSRANVDVIFNRSKEQLKELLGKPKEPGGEHSDWNAKVRRLKEKLLLLERETMLEKCVKTLEPPVDFLVGLVFVDALILDPTPERVSPWLKCDSAKSQGPVENALKKIVPLKGSAKGDGG
ncbi:MAG: RNA polymerase sigma factor [Planctomycetota bacterium]